MKNTVVAFLAVFTAMSSLVNTTSAQNALDLDGVNDFVQTTFSGITGTSPRTIEAWINTTANCNPSAGGVQQIITDWGVFATGQRFTFNVLWANAIRVEVSGSGLSGTIPVNDGLWHHVAVVYDPTQASQFRLYVDGVLDVAGNLTTTVNTMSGNMRIAQRVDGARHFDGKIDEVRVWNTAKSLADLQASANAELCGAQTGLVAYYQFNEGMAGGTNTGINSLPDLSGNNNNGTLINFALSGASSNWVAGASIAGGISTGSETVITCNDYLSPSGKYLWTASGMYSDTLQNTSGCDSVISVNLTVIGATSDTLDLTECGPLTSPSGKYIWSTSGTYADTIASSAGCDSLLTVNLVVNAPSSSSLTVDTCDSYTSPSGSSVWVTTGMYSDTLMNQVGCDSIITVDLTLGYSSFQLLTEASCGPFTSPSGNYIWDVTGTYNDTVANAGGCLDYLTIDVTVTTLDTSVTNISDSLVSNATGVTYQWMNCESGYAAIPGANGQGYQPTSTGIYAVQIVGNECADTSACFQVVIINDGLAQSSFENTIRLYPNPARDLLTIEMGEYLPAIEATVTNVVGQVLTSEAFQHQESIQMDLSEWPTGLYVIRLKSEDREAVLKVEKR